MALPRGTVLGTWRSLLGGSQPLPAPPSEDKDQPRPHHGPSCPVGTTEAAESPPRLIAALLKASLLGRSPSPSPLVPRCPWRDPVQGAGPWVSQDRAQDHADLLREPSGHAHQHIPAGRTAPGPALRPHPSVPGAGHPQRSDGHWAESIQRDAWPPGRTGAAQGSPARQMLEAVLSLKRKRTTLVTS